MVEQCTVVIYSKLKQRQGDELRILWYEIKLYNRTKIALHRDKSDKISFGTIYNVCGIIKRFTTIGKSCPRKAPGRNLKLTGWDVHLFRLCMSKTGTWQLKTQYNGQDKALEKLFMKHLYVHILKDVATHFINLRSKQFLTTANRHRYVAWAKSTLT